MRNSAPTLAPGSSNRGQSTQIRRRSQPLHTSPEAQARGHAVFLSSAAETSNSARTTMKHQRHAQRAGSVSDRSPRAPLTFQPASSVRRDSLLTIVLQLQLKCCCSAHHTKSAHKTSPFVRVEALTNKGCAQTLRICAHASRRRFCNSIAIAMTASRGRHCRHTAIYARKIAPPRRAAGVSRPLRSRRNNITPRNLPLRSVILD
jgi:hypothetical protein